MNGRPNGFVIWSFCGRVVFGSILKGFSTVLRFASFCIVLVFQHVSVGFNTFIDVFWPIADVFMRTLKDLRLVVGTVCPVVILVRFKVMLLVISPRAILRCGNLFARRDSPNNYISKLKRRRKSKTSAIRSTDFKQTKRQTSKPNRPK